MCLQASSNICFPSWLGPDGWWYHVLYHADVPSEKETSGYIFIHAEGGLNQQRIAVCMHLCSPQTPPSSCSC